MHKAAIIEDEQNGLINLKHMLAEHCDNIEVVAEADGVESGYELFSEPGFEVDIAFLDINLRDGKVFQLLNRLRPIDFDIIFVTAYDKFAMKACEYASIGYILKPIDPDALVEAVGRIQPPKRGKTEDRL
ncbi:MAG: response regulator, partial [Bacteroidota bacterium]